VVSGEVWETGSCIGFVLPELVGRQRWETESTAVDVRLLVWISRFRFVTAEAVAERFGISVQRSRARLRRLERIGLLGSWRGHVSQAKAFWITGRGGQVIGQRRRRAPQPA
jgi:predicted ArsR family transcriptional regulator